MPLQGVENEAILDPAMSRKGKTAHIGGTQQPPSDVPKHPHILKIDGRYYFRKRIPSDLVQAGCYGRAKDIKRALKTGDLAKANQLALTVALQVDEEFRAKRRNLPRSGGIETCFNSQQLRCLVDLSEIERRDFIIRAFIVRERNATRQWRDDDPDGRKEVLRIVGEDRSSHEEELNDEQLARLVDALQKSLLEEGITLSGADWAFTVDFAHQLRRAYVESLWRTERTLEGYPYDARDPLFRNIHADSQFRSKAWQITPMGQKVFENVLG